MLTSKEALDKTNKILSKPHKWCKGSFAKDYLGSSTSFFSNEVKSYCLVGALYSACKNEPDFEFFIAPPIIEAFLKVIKINYPNRYNYVDKFNDDPETTFKDIKKVLKDAKKYL